MLIEGCAHEPVCTRTCTDVQLSETKRPTQTVPVHLSRYTHTCTCKRVSGGGDCCDNDIGGGSDGSSDDGFSDRGGDVDGGGGGHW